MKTQVNDMKLAALSMGFLFLFSCTGDVTGGSAFQNGSVVNKSHEEVKRKSKDEGKVTRSNELLPRAVIPFFFGTVEATLQ